LRREQGGPLGRGWGDLGRGRGRLGSRRGMVHDRRTDIEEYFESNLRERRRKEVRGVFVVVV